MKRILTTLLTLTAMLYLHAVPAIRFSVERADPPNWWVGMENDTLQIMFSGTNIGLTDLKLAPYPGVKLDTVVKVDSHNYLIAYLTIDKTAAPGNLQFTFNKGPRKEGFTYPLLKRDRKGTDYQGFDSSDVLYLVMPDRFARGGEVTDKQASATLEHPVPVDRADPNARHGGNLQGLMDHLDYIDTLGVTAVWVNPVLENDMPGGSYHGYATTDFYRIDPRLGTNQQWNDLVEQAQKRGLKVVMDMIFNHSGANHPWFKDRPTDDWFNFSDGYAQTNYHLSTLHDPYASDYDRKLTTDGWFVRGMPDLNQRNPHLMRYLIQNSIWWIESSKINGIRMDTYPYANEQAMGRWIDDVLREYPNFNIVGECWYQNPGGEAYWQRGSITNPNGDPRLPVVMDFFFASDPNARKAFDDETTPWGGMTYLYDHLALDYLFPNPKNILTFLDNHDTDRYLLEEPTDLGKWKQALTFLLTTRGIPQIYYGTELLMNGSKEGSDGFVRKDMPGGFADGQESAFTSEGRTPLQNQAFDFLQKLLHWRKGNPVVADGNLKHFLPADGLYVYQRALPDGRKFTVIMNGTDNETTTDTSRFAEIFTPGQSFVDVLTGRTVAIEPEMTFTPREILILE